MFICREFTFSPSTLIRLDLNGKRMRPDQGWIVGFLLGLSNFKCTEIRLKELNCSRGLLGYDRCVKVHPVRTDHSFIDCMSGGIVVNFRSKTLSLIRNGCTVFKLRNQKNSWLHLFLAELINI